MKIFVYISKGLIKKEGTHLPKPQNYFDQKGISTQSNFVKERLRRISKTDTNSC